MSIIATDMKNIAIANGMSLSPYIRRELVNGKNTLQIVHNYATSLPGVDRVFILLPVGADDEEGYIVERRDKWTLKNFLECIGTLSQGFDNIFYFFADCPFLDSELTTRMFKNHQKYFADYTFADGYPYGLSPEIIKPGIINQLLSLADGKDNGPGNMAEVNRESIFDLIKKDMNSFDIETEISPIDLRLLRVSLSSNLKRNFILLERIAQTDARSAGDICSLLHNSPEILRTVPAFFSIQIVEGCPQLCTYCPYPVFSKSSKEKKAEMPLTDYEQILRQIESFCDDAIISISLWGEPSFHSKISEIIQTTVNIDGFKLIVETSGIGWNKDDLKRISEKVKTIPDWIVSLDSNDPKIYQALRGEGFTEANKTIEFLYDLFPDHVYAQAVRMNENEEDLENFYRYWKKKINRVIIQKYNSFCGLLPDRKITDLSPLKRFPCWHIKRDVNILIDGRVPICGNDIECRYILGNILTDGLEHVWEQGKKYYLNHVKCNYPEFCKNCDEYYTFNF